MAKLSDEAVQRDSKLLSDRLDNPDCGTDAERREWASILTHRAQAARIRELEAKLNACEPYLKPGETPRQRMDRDHADMQSVLKLWAEDKIKLAGMAKLMKQCEWALDAQPCVCIKKAKHRATCARCAALSMIRATPTPPSEGRE